MSSMKKDTVLIVEDEEDIASILKLNLEADGFAVITLNSGERVLQTVVEKEPSIILLDVMIPEKDGFEVCKELKAKCSNQACTNYFPYRKNIGA